MTSMNHASILDKVQKAPEDWEPPVKRDNTQPDFGNLDNPGEGSDFIFRPCYTKTGRGTTAQYKYVRHELPTGCTPVPKNTEGERVANGWNFYYKGWKSERAVPPRSGATSKNLFPESRKSSLDGDLLKKLGLSKERMKGTDALFFYQLLLPICDPGRSGIPDDPRKPFYTEVTRFSNLYKYQLGIGNGYGHNVEEIGNPEYVRYDGCIFRDGVRGGGSIGTPQQIMGRLLMHGILDQHWNITVVLNVICRKHAVHALQIP